MSLKRRSIIVTAVFDILDARPNVLQQHLSIPAAIRHPAFKGQQLGLVGICLPHIRERFWPRGNGYQRTQME